MSPREAVDRGPSRPLSSEGDTWPRLTPVQSGVWTQEGHTRLRCLLPVLTCGCQEGLVCLPFWSLMGTFQGPFVPP